jgi:predicted RND superfamily exporter protein
MFYELQQKVEKVIGKVFERYGRFIARHPLKVIFIAVFINAGFGLGLLKLKTESGIEQAVLTYLVYYLFPVLTSCTNISSILPVPCFD